MKTKLMVLMMVAGGVMLAETHFSIGVQVGRPGGYYAPAPAPVAVYRPPCPGPGYMWIDGYYDEYGTWYEGYWEMPPYVGAYWVAPRMVNRHFMRGYWGGPRNEYRNSYRGNYGGMRYQAPPPPPRRAPERWDNRGHDRGYDRGNNRGWERGNGHDRGGDRGNGWGRGNRR